MCLDEDVEVGSRGLCQTLVFKIYKQYLFPAMSFRQQLADALIQHIGLAHMPYSYHDIVALFFEVERASNDGGRLYFITLVTKAASDGIF